LSMFVDEELLIRALSTFSDSESPLSDISLMVIRSQQRSFGICEMTKLLVGVWYVAIHTSQDFEILARVLILGEQRQSGIEFDDL